MSQSQDHNSDKGSVTKNPFHRVTQPVQEVIAEQETTQEISSIVREPKLQAQDESNYVFTSAQNSLSQGEE